MTRQIKINFNELSAPVSKIQFALKHKCCMSSLVQLSKSACGHHGYCSAENAKLNAFMAEFYTKLCSIITTHHAFLISTKNIYIECYYQLSICP